MSRGNTRPKLPKLAAQSFNHSIFQGHQDSLLQGNLTGSTRNNKGHHFNSKLSPSDFLMDTSNMAALATQMTHGLDSSLLSSGPDYNEKSQMLKYSSALDGMANAPSMPARNKRNKGHAPNHNRGRSLLDIKKDYDREQRLDKL